MSGLSNTDEDVPTSPDTFSEDKEAGQDMMIETSVEIIINISDGKSFRALIDSVKQIGTTGIFIFRPNSFGYSHNNPQMGVLLEFIITKDMLSTLDNSGYQYDSVLEEYAIPMSIDHIKSSLTQINTKDGVKIYKPKDQNVLYIQRQSKDLREKDSSFSAVNIPKMKDIDIFQAPDYILKEETPTIVTDANNFKLKIDPMIKAKYDNVIMSYNSKLVTIFGSSVEGGSCHTAHFIDITPKVSIGGLSLLGLMTTPKIVDHNMEVILSIKLLKFFKKMEGYTGDNKIKFYVEHDKPIKLISSIKSFGIIKMYIYKDMKINV